MDTKLLLIAIFPGIALALIFYLADRFHREPLRILMKIFFIGMISVIPTAAAEKILINLNPFAGIFGIAFVAFIVAGFTEEFVKRHIVLKIAFDKPDFDEKLDGIIYAVFASLGFATAENINYVVFAFASNPYVGIFRGFVSVPAHMLFAITMGYYLSLAKFCLQPNLKKIYLKKALVLPIILHGTFDFILMTEMEAVLLFFIPFVIYLWVVNLKKLNMYYKDSKEHRK